MANRVTVVDRERGTVVSEHCTVAATPATRLKGLLGRRHLPSDEGLLIRPSSAVHTSFMRFPIDVVFLDRDLTVVDVVEDLRPWRAAGRRGAKSVLELASGEAARRSVRPGDRLALVDELQPGPPAGEPREVSLAGRR
jgi:uncharacterized protein